MGSGLIDPRWDRSSPNPHAKPSARLVGGIIKERERAPSPQFPLLPIPKPTSSPRGLFRRWVQKASSNDWSSNLASKSLEK